jgi:hypothetical protein
MYEEQRIAPIAKAKAGHFQASMWRRRKVIPADDERFRPEQEVVVIRACIQYSRYNWARRTYDRQCIWCDPHELRALAQAIEAMTEQSGGEAQ